jgi:hypothetical protein
MKFITVLAGALAIATSAHSAVQAPKLVGRRKFLSEMKARNVMPAPVVAPVFRMQDRQIVERQSTTGRCGKGVGSCSNCCSAEGQEAPPL